MSEGDEKPAGFLDSDDEEDVEKPNSFLSKWVGKLKNVVGDKKITKEDLVEVLNDFKQKLMEKNVAQEVAVKVTEAVGETLLSTKTKSFTTVHKTVT
jgi:signal recognition particle receptor subunit alpha